MSNFQLVKRLIELGWLHRSAAISDEIIRAAVTAYQAWHGISGDGSVCPLTQRHLNLQRMCSCPDSMPLSESLAKWPGNEVTCAWRGDLRSMSEKDAQAAVELSLSFINEVCGVRLRRTNDFAAANITMEPANLDGPGNVLAQSELADGSWRAKQQQYDAAEPFINAENPRQAEIDLPRVAAHELIHALGVRHSNLPNQLMSPTYSQQIRRPQSWDIQELQSRYGPPSGGSKPPPIPPKADAAVIDGFVRRIVIPGYSLVKAA